MPPRYSLAVCNLLNYLNGHVHLSDAFLDNIGPNLKARTLIKTELIVEEGGVCKIAYWIESGYGRIFSKVKDENGIDKEVTIDFCCFQRILVVGESFFNELPCGYHVEICVGSEVVPFTRENFDVLKLVAAEAKTLATKILALEKPDALEKMRMLKMKPRERYQEFLRIFGVEVERFFQVKQIASYLGMQSSYLSRLRGEIKKKKSRD